MISVPVARLINRRCNLRKWPIVKVLQLNQIPIRRITLRSRYAKIGNDLNLLMHEYELLEKLRISDIFPAKTLKKENIFGSFMAFKNNPTITYAYIGDVTVAEEMAQLILQNKNKKSDMIIEGNPGIGLLTHYLSLSSVKNIVVADTSKLRKKFIMEALDPNRNGVTFESINFLFIGLKAMRFLMECIERGEHITIVGVLPSFTFFPGLIKTVTSGNFRHNLKLEFFFLVSENVYNNIVDFELAKCKYDAHCLFHLLFNYEVLAEFPRNAILPLSKLLDHRAYLIKITSNENTREILSDDNFEYYNYFLRIMEHKRRGLVINTLEKWIPDCGPQLIKHGMSCLNQVVDITASESFKLFNILTECDGFSSFKTLQPIFEGERIYLQEQEVLNLSGNAGSDPVPDPPKHAPT